MRRSHRGRTLPTVVGAFPVDESPYGIRDLAGSMQDWCSDVFIETGPPAASARLAAAVVPVDAPAPTERRVTRVGSWSFTASILRGSSRTGRGSSLRDSSVGFPLARLVAWGSKP